MILKSILFGSGLLSLALVAIPANAVLCASALSLADAPWIGDGQPERDGADWYAEDSAPEFCAEFVLPAGVTETKIHFACAGFGWFAVNGAYMNADGLIPNCIGDHEALERAPNGCTATALWYEFVRLTATFARRLGKPEEAARFEALAEQIRVAFQSRYVKGGLVANGTQSAQAIGLYLGLIPSDQVAAAEARLLKAVEEKGFSPTTGIFSTRYLLMYLSEHGYVDVARKIVLHEGFPGWRHMLDRGATTLWETWKESDDTYSNCHPMFGSVDEWILRFGVSAKSGCVK